MRLLGAVDDLKAVTSGEWLAPADFMEETITALSTVLVYLDAALATNTTFFGQVMLLALLIVSNGLLAISNKLNKSLHMYGRNLQVDKLPQRYNRRLDLAEDLIRQSGRRDWAVRLGMVVDTPGKADKTDDPTVEM
jgi:hypothetical protein